MSTNTEANNAAWQAAGQAGAAGIAAIGQSVNSKKQFSRSKDLMELQMKNQEMMSDNAQRRQLEMWDKTNYGAQKEQMEKAGLNPALMYGMSGGGGTTVGSNSAGGAASGTLPKDGPMDVGAMVSSAKAMAELAMMKAQTDKTKAEGRKANVEADVTEFGKQTAYDESTVRGQELSVKEQELWAEMNAKNKYVGNETGWDMIAQNEIKNSNNNAEKEMNEAILSKIKLESERANINLTDERRKAIWHEIRQKWTQAGFKGLDSIVNGVFKGSIIKAASSKLK